MLWKVFTGDNSAGGVWTSPTVDTAINTVYVTTGTQVLTSQIYAQPW